MISKNDCLQMLKKMAPLLEDMGSQPSWNEALVHQYANMNLKELKEIVQDDLNELKQSYLNDQDKLTDRLIDLNKRHPIIFKSLIKFHPDLKGHSKKILSEEKRLWKLLSDFIYAKKNEDLTRLGGIFLNQSGSLDFISSKLDAIQLDYAIKVLRLFVRDYDHFESLRLFDAILYHFFRSRTDFDTILYKTKKYPVDSPPYALRYNLNSISRYHDYFPEEFLQRLLTKHDIKKKVELIKKLNADSLDKEFPLFYSHYISQLFWDNTQASPDDQQTLEMIELVFGNTESRKEIEKRFQVFRNSEHIDILYLIIREFGNAKFTLENYLSAIYHLLIASEDDFNAFMKDPDGFCSSIYFRKVKLLEVYNQLTAVLDRNYLNELLHTLRMDSFVSEVNEKRIGTRKKYPKTSDKKSRYGN